MLDLFYICLEQRIFLIVLKYDPVYSETDRLQVEVCDGVVMADASDHTSEVIHVFWILSVFYPFAYFIAEDSSEIFVAREGEETP